MAQVHLAAANVSMLRRAPRKTRISTALETKWEVAMKRDSFGYKWWDVRRRGFRLGILGKSAKRSPHAFRSRDDSRS
jgi:hypothetical protein